jgi:hypothetical protein
MSLQSRRQRSPQLQRHRQMVLALEKERLTKQMPDAVRSKCLALWAELIRSVIFKTNHSEGHGDER